MARKKAAEPQVFPINREPRQYHIESEYQKCRGFRHAMEPVNLEFGQGEYVLTVRCTRCTMTRYDFLDSGFNLTKRKYKPPKGYAATKGRGLKLADWRAKYLRDVIATSTIRKA